MALASAGRLGVGAWACAVLVHPWVPRGHSALEVPSAPVLASLSVGRTTVAGTLGWSAAVVHAGNAREPSAEAVWTGVSAALTLDGTSRAPAAQGALVLRRLGRADLAVRALDAGTARWPEEPWFPWARALIVGEESVRSAGDVR